MNLKIIYLALEMRIFKAIVIIIACNFTQPLFAQLGFCAGNSGSPIFSEDFGTGTANGPALPAGTTTYTYVNGAPNDGSYTITSSTAGYFDWFNIQDHTPDDISGKAFIVNASFTPGEFYRRTITGLCENTSYEFSSWLLNLHPRSGAGCPGNGIPVNVKFQILDSTGTNILAEGDTGDIEDKTTAEWGQYALLFTTVPGQTSVILKMINNGSGGCGNDLAIDDIVFRSCGDLITLSDTTNETSIYACEDDGPVSTTINATPDFSIFTTHFYQWQESTDAINWTDIPGETTDTYTTPLVNTDSYYRVKVSEDLINISNDLCNVISEVFEIILVPTPNPPNNIGDVRICENIENGILTVRVPPGIIVNWYDAPTGGTLLESNNSSYTTDTAGTYYAEAVPTLAICPSDTRTPVTLEFYPLPVVTDEELFFCENTNITLEAKVTGVNYEWNTGETTANITVSQPGTYTVEVTDPRGCSNIKTILLNQIDLPVIDEVISTDLDISISTLNEGEFEFSLDGVNFQDDPIFFDIPGGVYTISLRNNSSCGIVTQEYFHLVVPKFFTPNGDNINDVFKIDGIDSTPDYEINLYDRYGKLLKSSYNAPLQWDGRYNNRELPSGDYWYSIRIEDKVIKGHVSLKR
ncbi:T9SS type B sorting domain-containing protein [uncultured Muriicola sp.]|uniref:T9SS type B sorting domain-containing protein n=1 Tax=uncultured Muriicola sp. TaxID=1583102 RepID=UPI00262B69B1|nr:T9SS type B sorting domain-containing protein [uncultured Muriicola sp.]